MEKSEVTRKSFFRIGFLIFAVLFAAGLVAAQPNSSGSLQAPASLTGKYEGIVKDSTGETRVTLDLIDDVGKYSGTLTTQLGVFKLVKGQMADGVLTLDFETIGGPHRIIVRQKDGQLIGTAVDGTKTPTIELRKLANEDISGEWDAVADAQGEAFPFTLSLKLEGEKVTGSSNSQLGPAPISSGNWKDGKLTIVLEGGSGQIALIATMIEGKLSGDYDFAGQVSGKWVAMKKK